MPPTLQDIAAILADIAPEIDVATVSGNADLLNELDIDSMDFLNFVVALAKKYEIDVPEADYPQLATLDGCVSYVADRSSS